MKCKNCKSEFGKKHKFCPNCGARCTNKMPLIISLVVAFALIIVLVLIFIPKSTNENRTIMIYMDGSKYIPEAKEQKYSLSNFVDKDTNYDNNILLFVKGSNNWVDFATEDGLYEITSTGAKFIKKFEFDEKSLNTFLNYSYKNYKAGNYDLIIWEYGISEYKNNWEFYASNLEGTKFKNEKLEYVNIIGNVSSSIENAVIFSDYSQYLMASEELMMLNAKTNSITSLTSLTKDDKNIVNYGKKYILSYRNNLKDQKIDYVSQTYSILDLKYAKSLKNSFLDFWNNINLDKKYRDLMSVFHSMKGYGYSKNFDYYDLYYFISKNGTFSPDEAGVLLSDIENLIIFNWNNNGYTKYDYGLSFYFPYLSDEYIKESTKFLGYNYSQIQNIKENSSYTSKISVKSTNDIDDTYMYALNSPELEDFFLDARARVYKKTDEGYKFISIDNDWFRYYDTYFGMYFNIIKPKVLGKTIDAFHEVTSDEYNYAFKVRLYSDEEKYINAKLYYRYDRIFEEKAIGYILADNGYIFDLNDYKYIGFMEEIYEIHDENGKYMKQPKLLKENAIKYETQNFDFTLEKVNEIENYIGIVSIYDFGWKEHSQEVPYKN